MSETKFYLQMIEAVIKTGKDVDDPIHGVIGLIATCLMSLKSGSLTLEQTETLLYISMVLNGLEAGFIIPLGKYTINAARAEGLSSVLEELNITFAET